MNNSDTTLQANNEAKSVWENHADEEYRRDVSHWRGVGRWKNDVAWKKIGDNTKNSIKNLFRIFGRDFSCKEKLDIVEWGPGGGANLYSLREYALNYYGVDISQKNLSESKRMIEEEGFGDIFKPVLIEKSLSDVFSFIPESGVDIFLSTAVFQHFPSKQYGKDVLSVVKKILRPGALGFVQIRFDNGNPKYRPIDDLSSYRERHITANSYGLDEFWDVLKSSGFTPFSIVNINSIVNYAGFFFSKG